ncbi:flagellar hook assembly protein FlgD [Lysinibacillus endophyticus]|uniref:flagellar hook assembly protein FlgD n=1 Tax=Ureibacillus endophyticus TaxID=1978490 RepID=UPI00209D036D|nr:flagellar hook assembly protein FlgD [Lysinibacillus endophyticus]MCP1144048.1 flagellar hook assembly protein FlgD [Lysinibacillus endophyticus]
MTSTNATNETTSISNDYYLSNYKKKEKKTGTSELGKDAFLQILITQLQNQDPTQPMDDKEFISQMAQFSSLEQMQNMTTAMEKLLESQQQTQLMNYTTFIGKDVKWHELTDKVDEKGKPIVNEGTGKVKELKFVDGEPVFILEDGKEIKTGNISSVLDGSTSSSDITTENPLVTASKLIGQKVEYELNGKIIQGVIESVKTNNALIEYILSDGLTTLTKDQFTLVSE